MAVAATAGGRLLYLSAKGLGTGANPGGPRPDRPEDTDDAINSTQYLPLLVAGMASIGTMPSDTEVGRLTPVADDQVRPVNAAEPPAGTPLRKGGPIKHVFYIVRENRTYDQVLGDDARGDGDPKLTLFGDEVTPNAHALARRFPLLDHVYANSEASIDGHFWTSAATVPDYVNKNWWQNYAARGRPYDFPVYAVDWPQNGFLLDQAERQGISYFDYGEAIAGNIALPDEDRTPEETQQVTTKFSHSDIQPTGPGSAGPSCYPNDGSVGVDVVTRLPVFDTQPPTGAPPQNESRFACFKQHFQQQLATGDVPTFNYMVLSNDHTRVLTAGAYTPRAMVADNDEGLGRIVDLIFVGDLRHRGRLAGRRGPRRCAPHPGVRHLALREARRGHPHPVRLPERHPLARARDRDEAARLPGRAGNADVRRVRRRAHERRAVHVRAEQGRPAREEPRHRPGRA
jgi:hypothetical protein